MTPPSLSCIGTYYGGQLGDFQAGKPSTSHLYLYEKKRKRVCSPRILPDTGAASDPRGSHATESGGSRGNDRDGCGPRDAPWIMTPSGLRVCCLVAARRPRLLAVARPTPRGLLLLHSTSVHAPRWCELYSYRSRARGSVLL